MGDRDPLEIGAEPGLGLEAQTRVLLLTKVGGILRCR
jgi:hypothetical protein